MNVTTRGELTLEQVSVWATLTIQTKIKDHKGISH